MAHAALILAFAFFGMFSTAADAGYALLQPPPGITEAPASSGGGYRFKAPANMGPPTGTTYIGNGVVNVSGRQITVPASWRFAANAPSAATSFLRGNAYVFVGTAIAAWLLDEYLISPNGDIWEIEADDDPEGYGFTLEDPALSDFQMIGQSYPSGSHCNAPLGPSYRILHSNWVAIYVAHSCLPSPWGCNSGCTGNNPKRYANVITQIPHTGGTPLARSTRPTTNADWDRVRTGLANSPSRLHDISRHEPLPITSPEAETVTQPIGEPYVDPLSGDIWQDVATIQPSPTSHSPLRVRVDQIREPLQETDPNTNPEQDYEPDPNRNPEALPDDWPDFCIWAEQLCKWLFDVTDPPEEVEMPELELEIPDGPSLPSSGTCPPPRQLALGFGTFEVSYEPFCDLAAMIRPMVIASGMLFAAFILLGARRS